jgi:class 3 adenylate cyclase
MASAGLLACEKELSYLQSIKPVQRAVNLALKMMVSVDSIRWGSEENKLLIKIGIHYGRVISGVIGHHKPQFSLIGDTVNTTSRVCSTGQDGCIILSEAAYDQLQTVSVHLEKRLVEVNIIF